MQPRSPGFSLGRSYQEKSPGTEVDIYGPSHPPSGINQTVDVCQQTLFVRIKIKHIYLEITAVTGML